MKKIIAIGFLCLFSLSSMAGNKDLPNGKPFQNLQQQINVINMTIAEQKIIYDAKFAELAAKDGEHDALIASITVALNLVTAQASQNEVDIEALELANSLHDTLLNAIEQRLAALDTSTTASFAALYEQVRLTNQALGALNLRLTSLEITSSATVTQVSNLNSEIVSYRNNLSALDALLGNYCSNGEVVTGISNSGEPICRDISQLGYSYTRSSPLSNFSFCDINSFGGCLDTDYYESGSAYCNTGDVATGGGFQIGGIADNGGSNFRLMSYPNGNGWFVSSADHGGRNYSGGRVYVRCLVTQ